MGLAQVLLTGLVMAVVALWLFGQAWNSAIVLGLHVNVFIHVSLEKQVEEALHKFEAAISDRPEVMECYLMAGDPDYLIRVLVPSIQALERFMMDFLTKVPGVANIRSSFALKQVRYKTALPLPPGGLVLEE